MDCLFFTTKDLSQDRSFFKILDLLGETATEGKIWPFEQVKKELIFWLSLKTSTLSAAIK